MSQIHVWHAWIGQKVARCESNGNEVVIVLEDGRGIRFNSAGNVEYFEIKKYLNADLWSKAGCNA